MALWLIRAGKFDEHEQRLFADSACYLTWEGEEDRDLQLPAAPGESK
jgi:restriction system protein